MNGDDLRAFLAEWKISRAKFVDALALIGYRVETGQVTRWGDKVPATAVRLIEAWRDNPDQRPALVRRAKVIPTRKQA